MNLAKRNDKVDMQHCFETASSDGLDSVVRCLGPFYRSVSFLSVHLRLGSGVQELSCSETINILFHPACISLQLLFIPLNYSEMSGDATVCVGLS